MGMDFSKTRSRAMVDNVMKKVDNTELDNKKMEISLDQIDVNPDNEDIFGYDEIEHLANRIKENGFYGAIEVYAKKDGRYEIASGHRRYLACKSLGMDKIPCIVSADVNSVEKAKHLIEGNIHNRKMTPYIWAKAIDYYDKHVISQMKAGSYGTNFNKRKIIAEVFNTSESAIRRYSLILKLIPELQEYTKEENFPYTNIIELAQLQPSDQREVYAQLLNIAEDGNIGTISKVIVDQFADRVKNKKETDLRKNMERTRRAEPENSSDQVPEKDEAVIYLDEIKGNEQGQESSSIDEIVDIYPKADFYQSDENSEVETSGEETEEENSEEEARVTIVNRKQLYYHIQSIKNLSQFVVAWPDEQKEALIRELETIMKMIKN